MATRTFGSGSFLWSQEIAKSTNYTVVNTENGALYVATGAATFTLPSLANGVGCAFWFLNSADNTIAITAPANKLIVDGNATATTATFSTSSHKIGSFAYVAMNAAGTFYYIMNLGGTTLTVS